MSRQIIVEAIIEEPIPGLKVKFNGVRDSSYEASAIQVTHGFFQFQSQAPGKDKAVSAITAKTTAEFKREMIAFSCAVEPAKVRFLIFFGCPLFVSLAFARCSRLSTPLLRLATKTWPSVPRVL